MEQKVNQNHQSTKMFAEVAVFLPFKQTFDYVIPTSIAEHISVGMRVEVPFGKRDVVGIILCIKDSTGYALDKLKDISKVLDNAPSLATNTLELAHWASKYYHHPIGEVLSCCISGLMRKKGCILTEPEDDTVIKYVSGKDDSILKNAKSQQQLLSWLKEQKEPVFEIPEGIVNGKSRVLGELIDKGFVTREQVVLANDVDGKSYTGDVILTSEQNLALEAIEKGLGSFNPILLFGVTGSGKTEVYMHAINSLLEQNKSALVLVPEISLTPQIVSRFKNRFYDVDVYSWHSQLTDSQKHKIWVKVKYSDERPFIIIGTRSAIWLPVNNLGVIIVDEEHDSSFKQHDKFTYHGRDIAVMRARLEQCPIILGSATPSLETYNNAKQGRYELIKLIDRPSYSKHASIRLIDVRHKKTQSGLSAEVIENIRATLEKGEQAMVFLNRRGYAPALFCCACRWIASCKNCSSKLTIHKEKNLLSCHHCNWSTAIYQQCPKCDDYELVDLGVGTQKIEEELKSIFVGKTIARLDRDSTTRKGAAEDILSDFGSGKIDILVGTQMMAKGHDYHNLTLVAIVDIDQALFASDFRATEKLAQTVVQVSGRAGRGDKPGVVFLQTSQVDHPLLAYMCGSNYEQVLEPLLAERNEAMLPPFSYYAAIVASSINNNKLRSICMAIIKSLKNFKVDGVEIFGPVIPAIAKVNKRYRQNIILHSTSRQPLHRLISVLQLNSIVKDNEVRVNIDVDPYSPI